MWSSPYTCEHVDYDVVSSAAGALVGTITLTSEARTTEVKNVAAQHGLTLVRHRADSVYDSRDFAEWLESRVACFKRAQEALSALRTAFPEAYFAPGTRGSVYCKLDSLTVRIVAVPAGWFVEYARPYRRETPTYEEMDPVLVVRKVLASEPPAR